MHIPRLYLPQPLAENSLIDLAPAAAHHIAKVLRMKAGRSLVLFNGEPVSVRLITDQPCGDSGQPLLGEFSATLHHVDKKTVTVAVGEFIPRQTESSLFITLGTCLIKHDRMDWLLQKATELGVTTIAPLWSEYTDVKISTDRLEKKCLHWQQVVISACEQSERVAIPTVLPPQRLSDWVASVSADQKRVLHPYITQSDTSISDPSSVALLVGPEGGLSNSEVDLAKENDFMGMVLGQRILRAETAPLAALSVLQHQYGDFT